MGEQVEVVLDDQGRLVLPSRLQRRLGLEQGMALIVEHATSDAAYLKVQEAEPQIVDKGGVLVVQTQPSEELESSTRHDRDRRAQELLRRTGV